MDMDFDMVMVMVMDKPFIHCPTEIDHLPASLHPAECPALSFELVFCAVLVIVLH